MLPLLLQLDSCDDSEYEEDDDEQDLELGPLDDDLLLELDDLDLLVLL